MIKVNELGVKIIIYIPYTTDLVSCTFICCQKLKKIAKIAIPNLTVS